MLAATMLICVGAITDWLDGYLARAYQQESAHGKYIDPLADKVLTSAAFISFSLIGFMPVWMTVVILLRDVVVTVMRNIADSNMYEFTTSKTAKAKTFFQMTFIIYALTLWLGVFVGWTESVKLESLELLYSPLTYWLELSITVVTVFTMLEYLVVNRTLFTVRKIDG